MTDDHDIDALAGEYALGTLSAPERNAVAARLPHDRALADAVDAWEQRLAPLALQVTPVAPPPTLLSTIKARLTSQTSGVPSTDNVVSLERSRRRWRAIAATMTVIAATLAAVILVREMTWANRPTTFVAVLQKDSMSPAFILSVDTESHMITVRPVDPQPKPGKSYELWLVHESLATPLSLGLLSNDAPLTTAMLREVSKSVFMDATYAVSVEPRGGSKTGAPTGPVVFAGKLLPHAL